MAVNYVACIAVLLFAGATFANAQATIICYFATSGSPDLPENTTAITHPSGFACSVSCLLTNKYDVELCERDFDFTLLWLCRKATTGSHTATARWKSTTNGPSPPCRRDWPANKIMWLATLKATKVTPDWTSCACAAATTATKIWPALLPLARLATRATLLPLMDRLFCLALH